MPELGAALSTALQATALARSILLAECARPDGPRGEIGHCPADDEAEWAIRQRLLSAYPGWGYLGEESGAKPADDGENCVWFVDPNDGTSSMQRGARGHAISIAVVRGGVPVLGVVCAVDAPDDRGDLLAWAEGCGPILRNGAPVASRTWSHSLEPDDVITLSQGSNRNPLGYLAGVSPARFVGMPSIAYRLALVAAGDYAATLSLNYLSAWDYAAGHALLRAGGGILVDENGRPITYDGHSPGVKSRVFAGGPRVVPQLLKRTWEGVSQSGFGDAAPPPELAPVRAQPGKLVHEVGVLTRAQGCLLGQLAGDALGALVEFKSAGEIAARYPDGGPRHLDAGGPHKIMAGQPTDDSELALVLGRNIVGRGGFNLEAVAAGYAAWYHGWTHTAEPQPCTHRWCTPFDVGGTIAQALEAVGIDDVRRGEAAQRARAAASQRSQANGALMRISPLGIWGAFRSPDEVATAARDDASLTHPHPVCQDASAVFAVTIAASIRDGLDAGRAYTYALEWSQATGIQVEVKEAIRAARAQPPTDFLTQAGWVLVALQNAFFQLLHAPSLEEAVVETVRAGGDTDTNAAICGALLGAVRGRDAVPQQWQRMVLSCRPMPGLAGVRQPRPALFWPTDALVLTERLLQE